MVSECIRALAEKKSFSRQEFFQVFREKGFEAGEESLKKTLQKMLNDGTIVRVGRNAYCVPVKGMSQYEYQYSNISNNVARIIKDNHPYLEFLIFELFQLNEFVNHQLAHNIIFVSVESEIMDFVFNTLKESYPGRVLVNPTIEVFHQYWVDNMIVVIKMITEAPKGQRQKWHTRIESILVNLMTVPLLQESISENEYAAIFEGAFTRYVIDESCLFRYAKRRGAYNKIKRFIKEKTKSTLRTE